MTETSQLDAVVNNEAENRFELRTGDDVAWIDYNRSGNQITLTHTEVPEAFEGKGIGKNLVVSALEFARSENLEVIPQCRFVASYIQRHPEYLELVPEGSRSLVES